MSELNVGQIYIPGRTSWPELVQYNYTSNGHELVLYYASPSESEILGCRKGGTRFGLVAEGSAILLLYKIEGVGDWSDAPFNWHLIPEDRRQVPPKTMGDERAALQLLLVDAATGILKAARLVTWSPTFTEAIHDAIRRQATLGQAQGFNAEIDRLYAAYPTAKALSKIAHPTCKGGE